MTIAANNVFLWIYTKLVELKNNMIIAFDRKLVRCDAWFLVLLAVLMTLAFVLASAMAVWCVVYKGKKFTGDWNWGKKGVSVNVKCV